MSIHLFATLDTKGPEAAFVHDRLRECGVDVRIVDTGCLGNPSIVAHVCRTDFFEYGPRSLAELRETADRGQAVSAAARSG